MNHEIYLHFEVTGAFKEPVGTLWILRWQWASEALKQLSHFEMTVYVWQLCVCNAVFPEQYRGRQNIMHQTIYHIFWRCTSAFKCIQSLYMEEKKYLISLNAMIYEFLWRSNFKMYDPMSSSLVVPGCYKASFSISKC